jgi:uncharacterized protein YbaR (Trm112 family)
MVVPSRKDVFYRPCAHPRLFCSTRFFWIAAMDRKLLDILACPATRQPLALLESRGLDALNRAIVAGGIRRTDDSPQSESLREALVTRDRKLVYRIDDGIPVLLVEEAIGTGQVADFPKG